MNFIFKIKGKSKNILWISIHIVLILNLLSPCQGKGGRGGGGRGRSSSSSKSFWKSSHYRSRPYYSTSSYSGNSYSNTGQLGAREIILIIVLILVTCAGVLGVCYLCSKYKYQPQDERQQAVTRYLTNLEEQRGLDNNRTNTMW